MSSILDRAFDELQTALASAEAQAAPITAERDELCAVIERANVKLREEVVPRLQAAEALVADLRNQISQLQRGRPNARFLSNNPDVEAAPAS